MRRRPASVLDLQRPYLTAAGVFCHIQRLIRAKNERGAFVPHIRHRNRNPEADGDDSARHGGSLIVDLADSGMTMICVTREMSFARRIADRIVFMDRGEILEQETPDQMFDSPRSDRLRTLLRAGR
jgi:hypothetical protein